MKEEYQIFFLGLILAENVTSPRFWKLNCRFRRKTLGHQCYTAFWRGSTFSLTRQTTTRADFTHKDFNLLYTQIRNQEKRHWKSGMRSNCSCLILAFLS